MSNPAAAARSPLAVLIIQARQAKGMSQGDLAKAIEVSRGAVGQWETGKTVPTRQNLRNLADVLSLPVARLESCTADYATADSPDDPDLSDIVRFPTRTVIGTTEVVVDEGRIEVKAILVDAESLDRLIATLQAKRSKLPERES